MPCETSSPVEDAHTARTRALEAKHFRRVPIKMLTEAYRWWRHAAVMFLMSVMVMGQCLTSLSRPRPLWTLPEQARSACRR